MSRNSSTDASRVKGVESASTRPVPKDAGYLAHQAEQLLAQLEILHVFATQNPEACKPAVAGAIGAAFDTAANLSRELDLLEAAE
ncbi:hypothetical protein [Herbaspirillum aquaticum]|uniref:Uncharacterized protein n=1 Tax=Herbaspirillum aquaticum TaxID=568783 RepID=A0A225SVS6_9BURK|nr:hypothetical protein [Herbaspirillum aquaticum]OWY35273.1 hypothetical protein CEJ45_08345 [Herbaspirillum aquaticum]